MNFWFVYYELDYTRQIDKNNSLELSKRNNKQDKIKSA